MSLYSHPSFDNADLTPSQVAKLLSNLLSDPPPDAPVLNAQQRLELIVAAQARCGPELMLTILGSIFPTLSLPPGTSLVQALVQLGPQLTGDPETVRDRLHESDDVNQASPKPECEDCQRYRDHLLQKEIQIGALSDHINLLSQKRRKGASLLPHLFSSRTNTNGTAFVGSEIRESRPDHRGNTIYPSSEDSNTGSGCRCVIQ
ncbi:hypothetical protein FRC03_012722 [Tulasnella sp. 419]|nr:hypothetical protein FRC03_012722 [Tulasnella sp. 419]